MKTPQSASPVARNGGGDISERELSRERYTLQTTPPARPQPNLKKVQLAPVNKFTKSANTTPVMTRIKSSLDEYQTPTKATKMKATSMEDLTPSKRRKFEGKPTMAEHSIPLKVPRTPTKVQSKAVSMEDLTPSKKSRRALERRLPASPHSATEEDAAATICRFMVLSTWRQRRKEVRCLKKTLEVQVSSSERLRIQVSTLKHLLDSDNSKVRMAMKELERLKHLLKDKELEKAILEREKLALEEDICAVEDRASEMSIGWHNCRNELEGTRAAMAVCEHSLSLERAANAELRSQRDHCYTRLSLLEEELGHQEGLIAAAETEVTALNGVLDEKRQLLEDLHVMLQAETKAKVESEKQCSEMAEELTSTSAAISDLNLIVQELRVELQCLDIELRVTREQLNWWPKSLTRLMGAARSWIRGPVSIPAALIWALVPARHGC